MVYPGAVFVGDSPNQNPRQLPVSQVILHHTASTGNVVDIRNMFMQRNDRTVSANFLIAQNGDVHECVNPDSGRAWTTGSGPGGTISPDHSAITMECMNETGEPGWTQSAKSQETIAQVIAWAAKRYGFQIVRGKTVRGHREMPGQSTACPGGMPLDSITARAIEIYNGIPAPEPAAPNTLSSVIYRNYETNQIWRVFGNEWIEMPETIDRKLALDTWFKATGQKQLVQISSAQERLLRLS